MRSSIERMQCVAPSTATSPAERPSAAFVAMSLLLLLGCAAGAAAIQRVVEAEWLDDATSLAVTFVTGLCLAVAALVAWRRTWRRIGWRARRPFAFVPVGLLTICGGFAAASLPEASVEMEALVEAREPQAPAAIIEIGANGTDVRLSGELREGAAKRLAVLLDANPRVGRIHLTSEGGLADEGQALGDVIAAHGLSTFVPDYCVSACTLAFVRGRQRLVLEESRIGFHSPFETGLFGAVYQGDSSEQRNEYLAAGVADAFVDAALKVRPDDVWYPKPAQLIAAHVATAVVARDDLPDSTLDGAATLDGARAGILRDYPVLEALRVRSPDAIDAIARWYLEAYRGGRSEGDTNEALHEIVAGAVLTALTRAEDAALVEAGRFLQKGMAAAAKDPEACLRIGAEADMVEAESQLGRGDPGADLRARTIVAAAAAGHRTLLRVRDGGPLAALGGERADVDEAHCKAARDAWDALLRRPQAEAAAGLRRLADAAALQSVAELKTLVVRR